jgi:hypothetical protein
LIVSYLRGIGFVVLGLASFMAATPAMATWHINEEGEYFADFDGPDAQKSFNVYPAGIYEPALYFAGTVDWAGDRSDTIFFRLGDVGSTSLALKEFRAGFQIDSSIAAPDSGIDLSIRSLDAAQAPIFIASRSPGTGAGGSIIARDLPLISGQLYALTFSMLGTPDPSIRARYTVGLTIAEAVPEPSAVLLLGIGGASLAWVYRRHHRQGMPSS